jgi:dipeptidyl aminopeptidase/acylaminoacyl peptidase
MRPAREDADGHIPEEPWMRHFTAGRITLPKWARSCPDRIAYVAAVGGARQLFAWNRATGEHRQVTDQSQGITRWAVDPSGTWLWWFDDGPDERGTWQRTPFAGGAAQSALPGATPAFPAGLALGCDGTVGVGCHDGARTSVIVAPPGDVPRTAYESPDGHLVDISGDGLLLAVAEGAGRGPGGPRVRVLRTADGAVAAELPGTAGGGAVHALAFGSARTGHGLLCLHERRGRAEPLIWDPDKGEVREIRLDLPGEVRVDWYPGGTALLVAHLFEARSELLRYELATGELIPLGTPRGFVRDAAARPDGSVYYLWSSSAEPPTVRSTTEGLLLPPLPAERPISWSAPCEDAWVCADGRRIHALVSPPPGQSRPFATVFLLHGGPATHDTDSFSPYVAAWAEHGFCVIRVNYRGSTGYGTAWRDGTADGVGLTELADVAAVRAWAVRTGLADERRLLLAGASWGGYLTLLALGRMNRAWTAGIAESPIADYVMAYADEPERMRAWDRARFGGDPDTIPERYRESSPISYASRVRVPVLLIAGRSDPRCSRRQIEHYAATLRGGDAAFEMYEHAAGHGPRTTAERVWEVALQLDFARRHVLAPASCAQE